MNNIVHHFFQSAEQFPNKVAIWSGNESITFSALKEKVLSIQTQLKKKGIQKGDRVLVIVPLSIDFYATVFAIFSNGSSAVLLDQLKPKSTLLSAYKTANCKAILTTKLLNLIKYFYLPSQIWSKCSSINTEISSTTNRLIPVKSTDTALITFTSGTTGNPKAADRTHDFLTIQLNTLIKEMSIDSSLSHLSSLPVVMMATLASGATTVMPPSMKKGSWSQLIKENKINLISASPTYASLFLSKLPRDQFTRVFVGGSTIYPAFAKELAADYSTIEITFVYGSTEAEPISTISCQEYIEQRKFSYGVPVGTIHPNIKVKITPMLTYQNLDIGEILVQGKHVLNNYIDKQQMDWVSTGDLGYLVDNKLYFLGRKKYSWIENNELQSPLFAEIRCSELRPSATMLQIDGQRVLFCEKGSEKYQLFDFDQLIFVPKFHYDKRHNSRIDYEFLISIFKQRN